MDIDIRESIKENFIGATNKEIEESIINAIKDKEEIILPGLGVFFEILWENSNDDLKKQITNILQDVLKKTE
jgi:small acid-soluble spore protein I (minor)